MNRKKILAGMAVPALVFAIVLAGCDFPTNSDSDSGSADAGASPVAETAVNVFNLTTLVPAPVAGGTPVTVIDATQYTGSIEWYTGRGEAFLGGTFAADTVYRAVVTLSTKSGFTLTGVLANSFVHMGADTVSNMGNSGMVVITFLESATVVNEFELTALLTTPEKGESPDTTAIDEAQYTGSIVWFTSGGVVFRGDTFAAATVYRALVTFTAKSGFTFFGVPANSFTHMGASAVVNGASSGTVTITFPATDDAVVSEFDLSALVTAPVKGNAPMTMSIDATQYTGSIAWFTGDNAEFTSQTFADSTVYKARVTLNARSGYTFTGVLENSFTYTDATTVSSGGTVTITFPATEAESGGINVRFGGLPQDETIGLTESVATLSWTANTPMTVTVETTFSAYEWYVDGVLLNGQSGSSVTVTAQDYYVGRHSVSVKVRTTGGVYYSKTAHFTVAQ